MQTNISTSPSFLIVSAVLLTAAVAWSIYAGIRARRLRAANALPDNDESLITFGNLTLSTRDDCFYNERQERLRLTPMQYALMEMFYTKDTHRLTKLHICRSLWPGKNDADETLYALMRRLKPIVEENSNLHIISDNGRTYTLELADKGTR